MKTIKKISIILFLLLFTMNIYANEIKPKEYFEKADLVILYNSSNNEIVEVFKGEMDKEEFSFIVSDANKDLLLLFIKDNQIINSDYIYADYDSNEIELVLYSENYSKKELETILETMQESLANKGDNKKNTAGILFRLFLFIVLVTLFLYINNYYAKKRLKNHKEENDKETLENKE